MWRKIEKFTDPAIDNEDYFGSSVSIDGVTGRFLTGADGVNNNTGLSFFSKVK